MKKAGFIVYVSLAVLFTGFLTFVGIRSGGADPGDTVDLPDPSEYLSLEAPPIIELEGEEWVEPDTQRDDGPWVFNMFTPPKIFKVKGKFEAQLPKGPIIELPKPKDNPKPEFGISLDSVYRPPFRIRFQATILDPNDPNNKFVMLEHATLAPPGPGMREPKVVRTDFIRANVGKLIDKIRDNTAPPNPDGTYKMIPVNVLITSLEQVQIVRGGIPYNVWQATVKDFNSYNPQTEQPYSFKLIAGDPERQSGPDVFVTVRYALDPAIPPVILKNPQIGRQLPFNIPDVRYKILAFSENPPSLTLEKKYRWIPREGDLPEEVVESIAVQLSAAPVAVVPTPSGSPSPSIPGMGSTPAPGVLPPIPGAVSSPGPAPIPGVPGVQAPSTPVPGPSPSTGFQPSLQPPAPMPVPRPTQPAPTPAPGAIQPAPSLPPPANSLPF